MPPPTGMWTRPSLTIMVRMAMLNSMRAVGGEVADRAAVGAAAGGLEFFDDLHGADFGAPVMEPPGKVARSRSTKVTSGAERAFDGGDAVVDGGVGFDLARLGDLARCRSRRRGRGRCAPGRRSC